MVRQADGTLSGASRAQHRRAAKILRALAEQSSEGDDDAIAAELHDACADGLTVAAYDAGYRDGSWLAGER